MYSLHLADGTVIQGLKRLNPSTFELNSNDSSIYYQLSDFNLSLAILYDQDETPVEFFIDCTRQNFSQVNGITRFRLASIEELKQAEAHKREKEQLKRRKFYSMEDTDKEMRRRGW